MRSVNDTLTQTNKHVKPISKSYDFDKNSKIYNENKVDGLSYSKLAIKWGLTASRIGQIVTKHEAIVKRLAVSGGESVEK